MTPRGACRGAGRVKQDGVELVPGLPCQRVGAHGIRLQSGAFEVRLEQVEPALGNVERGNLPTLRRQLQRLAAGRGAQVEHMVPLTLSQEPRG